MRFNAISGVPINLAVQPVRYKQTKAVMTMAGMYKCIGRVAF